MTPKEVLAYCRKKDVKAVDLRFSDLTGTWRHLTIPVDKLREDIFEDGVGFDGSSVVGWQSVNESDILIAPQPETCFVDPFAVPPTLVLVCNTLDPIRREDYSRDPRHIARKSENYLIRTGIADSACFAPETEFRIYEAGQPPQRPGDDPRDAARAPGQIAEERSDDELTEPSTDPWMNLRNEMMQSMIECGMDVESHRYVAGAVARCCVDLRFQNLVRTADCVMMYKHIVQNVARRNGKTATFMSKLDVVDVAVGMQTHFSLWKNGEPIFAGNQYGGLSEAAIYAVGGILRHASAIMAFTNAASSFPRLGPNAEGPLRLTYGQRNRSVACRIPQYSTNPRAKRIELRFPDAICNPYLAFAAILMAAIDGIQNKLSPPAPLEADLHSLPIDSLQGIATAPSSLADSLGALERDNEFLSRGDVFTRDVIDTWIRLKTQ